MVVIDGPRHATDSAVLNQNGLGCNDALCTPECLIRTESCNPTPIRPAVPLSSAQAHNLPVQPTPLLGRAEDILFARQELLQDDVRLLTLTGPAGVGKTRLALGIADCVLDVFADGVYFVELAPTEDPALVTASIAEALGVREARDQPLLPRLANTFLDRSILLVLDNFEHVLSAADQLAALLALCPSIKILATSRAALRLRWEHVLRVAPLTLPPSQTQHNPLAAAAESTAVRLFVERAQAVLPTFELNVDNAAAINELCTRLDGLPLAIELAAARIQLLSPKAMLARLDQRFDLLVAGARDLPARQRTLRNALDYGFDLLPPDEQALFARLSLFAGGCTAEAATAVEAERQDSPGLFFEILTRLDSLLHKSLLQQEPQRDGQVRFHMLETIRSYAFERLVASDELDGARERWAEYYRALTERACAALLGHAQGEWLDVLDREHDNLRAVLRWCIDAGDALRGLELVGNLARFWSVRGFFTEGRGWLTEVLDLPLARARMPIRARALSAAGELAYNQGDYASAEALHRESLEVYRELEDRRGIATALDSLGRLIAQHGDGVRGLAFLEESLAVKRELDDGWGLAEVLHDLGNLATEQGQFALARSRYDESLLHWHRLGDVLSVANVFESMAIMAQSQGHSVRALRLAGASVAQREQLRTSCCAPAQRKRVQQCLDMAQRALGQEAATRAVEEGRALLLDEAVTYARTVEEARSSGPSAPRAPTNANATLPAHIQLVGLTAREREVAALLLRGMSNRQIAEQLVITERTAETHVCRILSKLGLGSRAQMAALIMDQELANRNGSPVRR